MSRSFGLAVLGVLAVSGTVPARGRTPVVHVTEADTSGVPRFHFRKTLFFNAPYLKRVAAAAIAKYTAAEESANPDAAELAANAPVLAAEYAKRYDIQPELARTILDTALEEGLDPELCFRLVWVESRFKTHAHGAQGALGLTQLMPATARSVDRSMDTEQEVLNPSNNLRIGFTYLREMIERYDGDVRLGVLAYNRGEVAVDRALRRGADPENGYSHKVLGTRTPNPYRGRGLLENSN